MFPNFVLSLEISYGFSRFGRYSYDIVDVLETVGYTSDCDKSGVLEMSNKVGEMILLSVDAIQSRDKDAAFKLCIMDDAVSILLEIPTASPYSKK